MAATNKERANSFSLTEYMQKPEVQATSEPGPESLGEGFNGQERNPREKTGTVPYPLYRSLLVSVQVQDLRVAIYQIYSGSGCRAVEEGRKPTSLYPWSSNIMYSSSSNPVLPSLPIAASPLCARGIVHLQRFQRHLRTNNGVHAHAQTRRISFNLNLSISYPHQQTLTLEIFSPKRLGSEFGQARNFHLAPKLFVRVFWVVWVI
jgi:hypothetical protein